MLRLQVITLAISCNRVGCAREHRRVVHHANGLTLPSSSRMGSFRIVKALKDETNGGMGGLAGPSWDPGSEIEVPFEQRPVNEYSSLKDSTLYSWGELSPQSFFLRLGGLWLLTFTVLGAPISDIIFFHCLQDPVRFVLAAGIGTLLLVSLIVLRIYLVYGLLTLYPCSYLHHRWRISSIPFSI